MYMYLDLNKVIIIANLMPLHFVGWQPIKLRLFEGQIGHYNFCLLLLYMFETTAVHAALFRPKICTKLSSFKKVVVVLLVVFDYCSILKHFKIVHQHTKLLSHMTS